MDAGAEHGIRRNKRKGGQTNPKKANWTTLKLGAFRCWCVGQNQAIFARLPKKDCATSTRSAYSIIPLSSVWCSVSHLHWFGGRQPFLRHLWKYDAASSWALPSSAPKQRWTLSNQSKTWKRVKRWRGVKLYCIIWHCLLLKILLQVGEKLHKFQEMLQPTFVDSN